MVNAAVILAFSLSLVLHGVLLVSCSTAPPHIIIKGIAIGDVRQPNVRSNVVTEIFLQSKLDSPACMAWYKVLLPGVRSSSSHPINPGQHYFLQALDASLHVESEAMWKDERRHNVTIASDHPKHYDVDRVLGFYYIFWKQLFCKFTIWYWQKFFSLEKNQSMFIWRVFFWVCSKALQHGLSSDKN